MAVPHPILLILAWCINFVRYTPSITKGMVIIILSAGVISLWFSIPQHVVMGIGRPNVYNVLS